MTITVTVLAKVDGDQLARALKLEPLRDAGINVKFEMTYQGSIVTLETSEDLIAFMRELVKQLPDSASPTQEKL